MFRSYFYLLSLRYYLKKLKVMPKISQRAENMPASPIRKLVPFALAAKQKGRKVYHLNIGQPDIETPQTALDELKSLRIFFIRRKC